MAVSDRVREIEKEIDGRVGGLDLWRRPKDGLLAQIMQTYRDAMEMTFVYHLFFEVCGEALDVSANDVAVLFVEEQRQRSGTLWALKWASNFCRETDSESEATPETLIDLLALGAKYEVFVDVLKAANRDVIAIHVDEAAKTLICYEGAQATPADVSIVIQQRFTSPLARQVSLTEDADQLTAGWTAGAYRRVTGTLAEFAAAKENDILVDRSRFPGAGVGEIAVPQPTVVWLEPPDDPEGRRVFDNLVLPADGTTSVWKLVSLLDTPIVSVGGRYCALSSDLRAISTIDEHMLRLAALMDPTQYALAANQREDRMIARCRQALQNVAPPWHVASRVKYANPPQEADVVATRRHEAVVIELKSTLRPETPWEVSKRNEDIVHGIKQTKALVDRGIAAFGFVLTDGYRGDYACWAQALSHEVAIGTLDDLAEIGANPAMAVSSLKAKVGLGNGVVTPEQGLPDREFDLMGWKFRLVDGVAPAV